jgi:hypothetical protein
LFLIGGVSNRGQDTDDRHNDHDFNQGETALTAWQFMVFALHC